MLPLKDAKVTLDVTPCGSEPTASWTGWVGAWPSSEGGDQAGAGRLLQHCACPEDTHSTTAHAQEEGGRLHQGGTGSQLKRAEVLGAMESRGCSGLLRGPGMMEQG